MEEVRQSCHRKEICARGWPVPGFGLRVRPAKREIPFDALRLLRAGSSLRLKNGEAQDDNEQKDNSVM